MSPDRPVLRARGLAKQVGSGRARQQILAGVDLDVGAGEMVAVLGRSGSGKSTLLHLLGGLDRPDRGRIAVAGEELTGASRAGPRPHPPAADRLHLPVLPADRGADRRGERAARRPPPRRPGRRAAPGGGADRAARGGARSPATARTNSPAASSSASRSPGPWSTTRSWSSPTRRPGTSTRAPAAAVIGDRSASSPTRAGRSSSSPTRRSRRRRPTASSTWSRAGSGPPPEAGRAAARERGAPRGLGERPRPARAVAPERGRDRPRRDDAGGRGDRLLRPADRLRPRPPPRPTCPT